MIRYLTAPWTLGLALLCSVVTCATSAYADKMPSATPLRVTNTVPDAVEHAALVALYNNTGGSGWTDKTDWLQGNTAADFATWHGVTVENGDVVSLDLSQNNLSGALPPALGDLAALEYLNLGGNRLTTVPTEIGSLSQLVVLYLNSNNLTSLPDGIGGLISLGFLDLSYNNISELPASIGNLAKLGSFYMYLNQLTTLPATIGGMSRLESIFLFGNPLTSLPPEIGDMPMLRGLFPKQTQLTTLPAEINQCANLEFLNVADSQLDSLPPMDNLPKLRGVIFNNNDLRTIPDFSNHPNKANLNYQVQDNRLDLNYIAQHLNGVDQPVLKSFVYRPQGTSTATVPIPGPTLSPFPDHPQSSYQWQKQVNGSWQNITGATDATYTVSSIVDGELYRVQVTNAWLPNMSQSTVIQPVEGGAVPPATTYWIEAECATAGVSWRSVDATNAAGGKYLYAPGKNSRSNPPSQPAAHLVFTLDVAEAGDYHLLARINAPSNGGNSLWFRVDGGAWVEWWEGIATGSGFGWNRAPGGLLALSAGAHTLTIAYREGDTRLDKLALSTSSQLPSGLGEVVPCEPTEPPIEPSVPVTYWREAECAEVGTYWSRVADEAVSGGSYLQANTQGSGPDNLPREDARRQVAFTVDVAEAGTYYLFGHSRSDNFQDDSFFWQVNDGIWEVWDAPSPGRFAWDRLGSFELPVGTSTIRLANRESNARLDKLALSSTDQLPSGLGEADSTCQTTPLPDEVPGEPVAFEPQWGGNVAAMVWSTFHYAQPTYRQAYTYDYSKANRLTAARYASQDTEGGWTANQSNYSVKDVGYDANGNITGLTRYTADPVATEQGPVPVRRLMDQLSYSYSGNRVQAVSDAADAELGFADGASNGSEYGYDANGNLTRDDNKGITNIEYDPVLDVPLRVDFADGARIDYLYDAAGNRLAQTITAVDGTRRTTDYLGAVEYRDDQLALIHHPEGRVIQKNSGEFVYHYDLRDHLGNVRLTFSEEPMVAGNALTMEAAAAPTEEVLFQHVAAARQTLAYHNTTAASSEEPQPNKVATLRPGQTGPAKSLSVRRGDKVHLQVNAAYETGRGKVQGLEGIATEVAGALEKTAAGLESGGAASGINGLAAGSALARGEEPEVPPAYLNYLVYDEQYRLVDQGFRQVSQEAAVEVGSADNGPAETLALDVEVKENGYLYAYLSHEAESSGTPSVYFDDFEVTHEGISIVQHNDYYAFGAVYQQSVDRVLSNAYLYQGKELQDEFGLELYDFHARQYDPLLGRMNSVDPMAAFFDGMSPYAGMGNNPVSYVDPDGQVIGLAGALIGGAVLGGGAGYLYGKSQGYTGRQMFYSIAGGMAAGAGIAAGIQTGFFANVGQSIAGLNVPGALDANIGYAERIFQGVKPIADGGLSTAQAIFEVGPVQGMEVVDNMGWGVQEHLAYQRYLHQLPSSGSVDPVYVEDMFFGGGGSLLRFGVKTLSKGTTKLTARGSVATINGFKSIGAAGRSLSNVKLIKPNMLKKAGIDAHALKTEFLGPKGISRFDLYRHTETGEILIMQKGGVGEAIFTGIFL